MQFYFERTSEHFIAIERGISIFRLNAGKGKNVLKAILRSDFSHSLGHEPPFFLLRCNVSPCRQRNSDA